MSKNLKISLITLITVILLLAVALPGLAKENGLYTCHIVGLKVNQEGVYSSIRIYGELEAYWQDGILYNICRGISPLGEPIDPGVWRYATFEETCDYYGDRVTCTETVLSITKEQWGTEQYLFDPETKNTVGPATDYSFIMYKYSGEFEYYKEYEPAE